CARRRRRRACVPRWRSRREVRPEKRRKHRHGYDAAADTWEVPMQSIDGGGLDKQARPVDTAGWEYKGIKVGPSSAPHPKPLLNGLGGLGWDQVVYQPSGERACPGEGEYIFKRPRTGAASVRA